MERIRFTAWISKYALTEGIYVRTVEDCFDISSSMVRDTTSKFLNAFHMPHWHRSREEAITQAEKMRIAKIKTLKIQLSKLEAMTFETTP